jgi:NADP-dependent 3-hydroxy acid dehydrogenase YdfG
MSDAAPLVGKVAWISGGGSGIGEAAARALAPLGATVVLTGRRRDALDRVASGIAEAGGEAIAMAGDVTSAESVEEIAARIGDELGRIDILVNNAGRNIDARHWDALTPSGIDAVVDLNLTAMMYCVTAVLPAMRRQAGGLVINTASIYGRLLSRLPGPAYLASKHAVVAMTHSINMEECVNGIRATAFCPGEVATPLLDTRPVPVSAEMRARMIQPEDCGRAIAFLATLPPHLCVNEFVLTPTWNREYVTALSHPF